MKLGIYLNAQQPAGDDPARRFAEMVEQARLIRSLGLRVSRPGMPQADVLAGIELPGREVLPDVRRRTSPGR